MLVDLIWVVVFALAIYCTVVVTDMIVHDRDLTDAYDEITDEGRVRLGTFFAAPILWAIIVVFYFN